MITKDDMIAWSMVIIVMVAFMAFCYYQLQEVEDEQ